MTTNILLLESNATIEIPPEVAVCPYCGGELYATCEHWSQVDDGSWVAETLRIDCKNEPDLDDDKPESLETCDEFIRQHTYMPYVYWLPVDVKLTKWVNERYRWNL